MKNATIEIEIKEPVVEKEYEVVFNSGANYFIWTIKAEGIRLSDNGDLELFTGTELVAAFRNWNGIREIKPEAKGG